MDFIHQPLWVDSFDTTRSIEYITWVEAGTTSFGSVHYLSAFNQSTMESGGGILYYEAYDGKRYAGLITGQWDLYPDPIELGPGTLAIPVSTNNGVAVEFEVTDTYNWPEIFIEHRGAGDYWGLFLDNGNVEFTAGATNVSYDVSSVQSGKKFKLSYYNGRVLLTVNDRIVLDQSHTHTDTTIDSLWFGAGPVTGDPTFAATQFSIYRTTLIDPPENTNTEEISSNSAQATWAWGS